MDQGFPGQHTTTTTVTSTTMTTEPTIRFDKSYIRTWSGMLKLAEVGLNLLGFISITMSVYSSHSRGAWFNTVAMSGFWLTGILLILYLFHIVEKFARIPWLKLEFIYCTVWTLFYLLAASLVVSFTPYSEAFVTAAFFGYCAMFVYGYDAWLKFKAVMSGGLAQGQSIPKQLSGVTSPAY
ncbi:PREDICTED: uncharacterized protein LOC108778642 [Cyphomyrmex costatus]|uniref:CKLF-like MARVEL transmembrane domain-containing protein 4 n=1 Tax=Cyphomyrmex costatus TaxID=456900 RepID=A0A151IBZ1_9HYME|nr:PREDICTED: uncharacterized protein LOC108778642 [Cyphomyrmex costatus]XP_018401369.1 PREDICTED: uncharacterized protein LOC108778642 [Cyphomyrmex costatus]XP_018401370.1 PREDICTED: uncharacterized protein LOC108778642 [Cyphomyrmex costatus]KYM97209.1 CKLF-like MARVEL transmembrane domain-containing protein 4 [Cyphomyrmex costatus]